MFEKSIILPTQYEINEYQIIVDFIDTIDNEKLKTELQRLIQGKGAFKRFKDYCFESNIIQDWYKYKEQRYKEIAIDWCNENGLKYKDFERDVWKNYLCYNRCYYKRFISK